MGQFLLWIGVYNIFGAVLLLLMQSDAVADVVLRKVTEIAPEPYKHEGYSRMWLAWVAMTNLFVGVVMVRAVAWPVSVQREVTLYAVGLYVLGEIGVIVGMRRPRYARGIYALHPLWLAQMGWGLWAYWQSTRGAG